MDRIDFKVSNFDKAILEKGANVLWEEAMFCSCLGENKGQPNFNCKFCKGSGYIYSTPVSTIALVSNLGGNQKFEPLGNRNVETAYLTALSTVVMGFHDRITFSDLSAKYSEVINIKFGKSLKLKHQIKTLSYVQYKDLRIANTDVTIINDGWNIQISPDIINTYTDDDKQQKGNDFYVSLLYVTAPSYSIIDIPHELRGTQVGTSTNFVDLPRQYLIKREDFTYVQATD